MKESCAWRRVEYLTQYSVPRNNWTSEPKTAIDDHCSEYWICPIVKEKLECHSLGASWILKMLTDHHKKVQWTSVFEPLFTKRKVIFPYCYGRRNLVSYTDAKSKQWRHSRSPKPKKFLQFQSTITTVGYYDHSLTKACDPISMTRYTVIRSSPTSPQRASSSCCLNQKEVFSFLCKLFDHPGISPELAPSDYSFFCDSFLWNILWNRVVGKRFKNDEQLRIAVVRL